MTKFRCVAFIGTILAFLTLGWMGLMAQTNPTGSLSGTVTDPSGAAIPGATVVVTEPSTQRVFNLQTDATGRFVVANLSPSVYDVVVSRTGFQSATYRGVQIVVNQTYTLKAQLKIGAATQSVEVQAGQQVIETQQTSIGDYVTGQAITQLPVVSRNTEDMAFMEPGAQVTGAIRSAAFEGLPGGALNITVDGIAAQDQSGKSGLGDSLFAMTEPRLDDVQEFNITEAANSATDNGEGAVQIAMVSNKGTNAFHGGGWEYLRNTSLDANNYFNNLTGQPRQTLQFNQWGYKIGGPIIKNKLFFFTDLDIWDLPSSSPVNTQILTAGANGAATGFFTYVPTATPTAAQLANAPFVQCGVVSSNTCTANLMGLMGAATGSKGQTFSPAIDSVVGGIINSVTLSKLTSAGATTGTCGNSNCVGITYNAPQTEHQYTPDLRLDYTLNNTNSFEWEYHFSYYNYGANVLDAEEPLFPVAPYTNDVGNYISDRTLTSVAWRDQIRPTMNNELRFGIQAVPGWFDNGQNDTIFPQISTPQGTTFYNPGIPSSVSAIMTDPFQGFGPSKTNAPLKQVNETLSWLRGNHSMTFGASYTNVAVIDDSAGETVASVGLGMSTFDPALSASVGGNDVWSANGELPGISTSDLGTAENLWATLAGRVTSFGQTQNVNPVTRAYSPQSNAFENVSMNELGLFATDNWRMTPNLTFNYGLRWEFETAPKDNLNEYYAATGNAYGISGYGNLFAPGTETGSIPGYALPSGNLYPSYKKGFAPSVGLSWTPSTSFSFLKTLLGEGGQSVFRGGYSIAYDREGLGTYTGAGPFRNPGQNNNLFANAEPALTAPGQFLAGSVALQGGDIAASVPSSNVAFGQPFAVNTSANQSVFYYDSDLRPAMVQSWSLGWQRQLNSNTAFEIRYVGNHATRLLSDLNLNEVNIFENGFLSEFKNAASNLNICTTNATACTTAQTSAGVTKTSKNSFADWGLPGQVAVPITTASFTGTNGLTCPATGTAICPAGESSQAAGASSFSNSNFVSDLSDGLAGAMANTLSGFADWTNLTTAGFASNFWKVDPTAGNSEVETNINQSTYNSLQAEFRRRMADGLEINANYVYSHSLGNNSVQTLRDYSASKGPVGTDLRHVFKIESLYQLPFGAGRRWKTGMGLVDNVLGGWDWDGITRWQSGDLFLITSGLGGTVNANDPGVSLVGINVDQLQSQLGVIKQTNANGQGVVYYAPAAFLGANEQKANVAVIAPCETAGQFCSRPYFYGPGFFRADWSLVKNTKLTEKISMTLRANVLNAFNNINFSTPRSGSTTSTSFMQITSSYSDYSNSQDPGGRVVELVARLNF